MGEDKLGFDFHIVQQVTLTNNTASPSHKKEGLQKLIRGRSVFFFLTRLQEWMVGKIVFVAKIGRQRTDSLSRYYLDYG